MTSKPTPEEREVWSIGDLRLDVGQQRLWRGSDELTLPKLSFDLLLALARRAPDVVTYDELMDRVWPGLVVSPETIVQPRLSTGRPRGAPAGSGAAAPARGAPARVTPARTAPSRGNPHARARLVRRRRIAARLRRGRLVPRARPLRHA